MVTTKLLFDNYQAVTDNINTNYLFTINTRHRRVPVHVNMDSIAYYITSQSPDILVAVDSYRKGNKER